VLPSLYQVWQSQPKITLNVVVFFEIITYKYCIKQKQNHKNCRILEMNWKITAILLIILYFESPTNLIETITFVIFLSHKI